jgi:FkbM family methyltransferase
MSKKNITIYDIGANHGNFTKVNMDIYKDAKFILVEANPYLCDKLNNIFSLNNNVTILNRCLHSHDDVDIEFYINNDQDTISTASRKWIEECRFKNKFNNVSNIKVKSISIESLINMYGESDHIKIDVEGYEHVVMQGIKKYHGLLSFEWEEEMKEEIRQSLSKLDSIGYKYFCLTYNDTYSFIPSENDYMNYHEMCNLIDSALNSNQYNKVGMIFAR